MKFFKFIYKVLKALWDLHVSVITANNGVSSKAYIMVLGVWIGFEVTQVVLFLTVLDYFETRTLNYAGIATLLGGLSVLILASAWGKTKSDQAYYNSNNEDKENP